jgi:DNA-binding response OmpR family regulator
MIIHASSNGIKIALSIIVDEILLCTHNPLLVKNFYGILRDEGFNVMIADHSALAVQMVFQWKYRAVIIDSESFGLPVEEAVRIIRSTSPEVLIIVAGLTERIPDVLNIRMPVDLEEFKQTIRGIRQLGTLSGIA